MKIKLLNWIIGAVVLCSLSAVADGLYQTGQKKSYSAGDDGDHQAGLPRPKKRFVDNKDGTITDKMTGLVWLENANAFEQLTWEDALTACNTLKDGDHDLSDGSKEGDWRMPNRLEIESLIDFSEYRGPTDPFINSHCVYWSSTTGATHPERAWKVDLTGGNVGGGYIMEAKKVDTFCVWPVRGGVTLRSQTASSKTSSKPTPAFSSEPSLPDELLDARKKYMERIVQVAQPVTAAYIEHLEKRKAEFVKKDDLEKALLYKKEIEWIKNAKPVLSNELK